MRHRTGLYTVKKRKIAAPSAIEPQICGRRACNMLTVPTKLSNLECRTLSICVGVIIIIIIIII